MAVETFLGWALMGPKVTPQPEESKGHPMYINRYIHEEKYRPREVSKEEFFHKNDSVIHVAEVHHDNNWHPEQNETAQEIRHGSVGSETQPYQPRTLKRQSENRKLELSEEKQKDLRCPYYKKEPPMCCWHENKIARRNLSIAIKQNPGLVSRCATCYSENWSSNPQRICQDNCQHQCHPLERDTSITQAIRLVSADLEFPTELG